MFEHLSYEMILQRMLDHISDRLDKREGSIIWDALAPAAAELKIMYIELDVILQETFADTASREYLICRAAERGMSPTPASHAILRGVFNIPVPIGSRFSLDTLDYVVIEQEDALTYRLRCETAGAEGNRHLGTLIPIQYIQGLSNAELTEVLIPGENEEETEVFRQRYLADLDATAFGGNIRDYQLKVNAIQGVGGVKVYPVWNGGGTVKLVIISSEFAPPSAELVDKVQTEVDPETNHAQGLGIAPMGHFVTVLGVTETRIDTALHLTYQSGYNWGMVEGPIREALTAYYKELRQMWEKESQLVVRISQIETRILGIQGILDVADTRLNGQAGNLILDLDAIPVGGDVIDS